MSFHDLPRNIRAVPLTSETVAADVIDLMISERDRARGCIGIMLCDSGFRGIQPVVVTDIPANSPLDGLHSLLGLLLPMVEPGGGVLVGRGRGRGSLPTDTDRAWHQATIDACAAADVTLLGYYLATLDQIAPMPAPLPAST